MATPAEIETETNPSEARREASGITVEVQRLVDSPDGRTAPMFMAHRVGEGELDGRPFCVATVIPDGSLLIEFDKAEGDDTLLGRDRFLLPMRTVLDAVAAHIRERDA